MFKMRRVDQVRLHMRIPKAIYWVLNAQFTLLGKLNNKKPQKVHGPENLDGRWLELSVGAQKLRVSLCRLYKSRWIEYQFNGLIDVRIFEDLLVPLQVLEASLGYVIVYGTVKRLELAIDYGSAHTSEFMFHSKGVKTGKVFCNSDASGRTYSLGSLQSKLQVVAYDKGQQLLDTGQIAPSNRFMRIEAKLQHRDKSLVAIAHDLMAGVDDPFAGLSVVAISDAKAHNTHLEGWLPFVASAAATGVPKALAKSLSKKTFLSYLEKLAAPRFQASGEDFGKWFDAFMPFELLTQVANSPPISQYGE